MVAVCVGVTVLVGVGVTAVEPVLVILTVIDFVTVDVCVCV